VPRFSPKLPPALPRKSCACLPSLTVRRCCLSAIPVGLGDMFISFQIYLFPFSRTRFAVSRFFTDFSLSAPISPPPFFRKQSRSFAPFKREYGMLSLLFEHFTWFFFSSLERSTSVSPLRETCPFHHAVALLFHCGHLIFLLFGQAATPPITCFAGLRSLSFSDRFLTFFLFFCAVSSFLSVSGRPPLTRALAAVGPPLF